MSNDDDVQDESVTIAMPRSVYLALQRFADFGESPAQALARLLSKRHSRQSAVTRSSDVGTLFPLMQHGLVSEGDEVEYRRVRRGEVYTLTAIADGFLQFADGRVCSSPSGVVTEINGTTDNGWRLLKHLPSGNTLGELRDQLQETNAVALKSSRAVKPYSSIKSLVDAGVIAAGDALIGGRTHRATVGDGGTIVLDGIAYTSPTRAWAVAVGNTSTDVVSHGWTKWRHIPSGLTLFDIRENLIAEQKDPDQ